MLQLCGVTKVYGAGGTFSAVSGVDLRLERGEFCALVGPSGSGKSTLMNLIGLLDRPTLGAVLLDGRDVSRLPPAEAARVRNADIGFVFQTFHLLPRLAAWENVALPLFYRGVPRADREIMALAGLERVGLADKAASTPVQLSGGQRQRVAIARALIGKPKLLLADEPTGSLDSRNAASIMELFVELNAELGVTTILVTHDLGLAARCPRRIELLDGRIVRDTGAA